MKILMVIPAVGSVYGGPSQIALDLARSIGHAGIHIDLVTTSANGSKSLDVPVNTWISENCYRIQYFSYLKLNDYKISFSLTRWLFKNITNYDIVHTIAIFSYTTSIAHLACKINHIPYIMNPQGMLEPWALSYKAWKKKKFTILHWKSQL